jgi:excisionase family DNA binding protein
MHMKNSTILSEISPEEFNNRLDAIEQRLDNLRQNLQPKTPAEYLTRNEVAQLLKVDLSTIHNWCKKGKLIPFGIGARVYFKRTDIEFALKQLKEKKDEKIFRQ